MTLTERISETDLHRESSQQLQKLTVSFVDLLQPEESMGSPWKQIFQGWKTEHSWFIQNVKDVGLALGNFSNTDFVSECCNCLGVRATKSAPLTVGRLLKGVSDIEPGKQRGEMKPSAVDSSPVFSAFWTMLQRTADENYLRYRMKEGLDQELALLNR